MQPVQAQEGASTKGLLFDSLQVYLTKKNRLQPIIGLGSIIECVKAGTHNREVLYLCEVCVCRLSKADIRNHIMGSLHRYNYIKAWHPNLVSGGKEKSNLSKMAWSLMEIAKTLEGMEGPGDVQLLEVEDAVYRKMATHSESDVSLINILRNGQGEPERHSGTATAQHHPNQSQRIVLLAPNQRRQPKKSLETSAETRKPPSLMLSIEAPCCESECWSNNTYTPPELSVLSKNSNSFLDDYIGTEPLIGLFRVVECRGEDDHTYCFLCHCCRIRSNQKDIIDHLTSSSHRVNYLMETQPEQVEVTMADINDNHQLLQSLAKKVEREEGRGELKVVVAPESLCILLTSKSYHWCIQMLCNEGTDIQKRGTAAQGPSVSKTSNEVTPGNYAVVRSKVAKKMTTKRKMRKVSNPVFKVSLPLTKASVLLERTSFSVDSLPLSSASSSNSDVDPSLESQSKDCPLECDTGSCAVNHNELTSVCTTRQLQQAHYSGDTAQYTGPVRNFSQYQEEGGYFRENEYLSQSEDTGTQDQRFYGEQNYNRLHGAQERSHMSFYTEWNEGLPPAVRHAQDWSSYNSYYGPEEGCTVQWYNSTSQRNVGTRVEMSEGESQTGMTSDATQHYYQQQQPQNQYVAGDHTSLQTGSVGWHGLSGELAAHSDAAGINMHPHLGYSLAHSGSIAAEPGLQFLEMEQRQLQTNMECNMGHVPTAPQSYVTQPATYQAVHVGHGLMSNPSYYTGPGPNPDQHLPHRSLLWSQF